MTLSERQCLFIHNLAILIQKAEALGYGVKIAELNRTIDTQKKYVAEGKSKTMNSKHLDNCAADLVLFKDGQTYTEGEAFRALGEYWESLGGRWGGRFGLEGQQKEILDQKLGWDTDHFEI